MLPPPPARPAPISTAELRLLVAVAAAAERGAASPEGAAWLCASIGPLLGELLAWRLAAAAPPAGNVLPFKPR